MNKLENTFQQLVRVYLCIFILTIITIRNGTILVFKVLITYLDGGYLILSKVQQFIKNKPLIITIMPYE